MLNEKGERALAYVVTLDEKKPLEGYDLVEYGRSNGWWCVISKRDNIQVGDKCIYFEVDSKVPNTDERFAFLEKRNYKIKTQKMCKVLSQGLLMPITLFPELKNLPVGTDVTEKLGVKYSNEEDNERKANNKALKYQSMMQRRKNLFRKPWAKWFMKRAWGRRLMFLLFGKKRDNPRGFPTFISKTDEERIENQPWRLGQHKTYIVTEKLDGTSCTYALERKRRNKFEFYVCSRNVRQKDEKQACYHDRNVYWDLAFKYNIEEKLREYLKMNPNEDWVAIQGEGVGSVQGNPLKLAEDDLYVFNFITSNKGRFGSIEGRRIVKYMGMKWVPILKTVYELPETMDEMKKLADGQSALNDKVMREGLVYRSADGKESFKNVSNQYLLRHS